MQNFIQHRQLRALAVMSHKRLPNFADIPAIDEAGLGGDLEVQAWQGVLVKAGTPPDVVAALNRAVVQAMNQPETRQRIAAIGVEPMATSAASLRQLLQSGGHALDRGRSKRRPQGAVARRAPIRRAPRLPLQP